MAFIYFKEKHGDGYRVFAKDDKIPTSQIDAYIKDGCVKCDADGKAEAEAPATWQDETLSQIK